MSLVEELTSQFEAVNVTVPSQVLEKCEELCTTYKIDSEDFIDLWLAYTASNLNGAPPTLDALDRLERKELKNQKRPISAPKSQPVEDSAPAPQEEAQEESIVVEKSETNVPGQEFLKRNNACSVKLQFGNCDGNFKDRCKGKLVIRVQHEEIAKCKYMTESHLEKKRALSEMSRFVIVDILKHHNLELTYDKLNIYCPEMTVCGRIYTDTEDEEDPESIELEGHPDIYEGRTIKLNFLKLDKMSLFNGQTVVIYGHSMIKNFMVDKLFTGIFLPKPEIPITLNETLQMMVASGPFTLSDNLLYEPLDSLLKHVIRFKPNLLILMGPFVDKNHSLLMALTESFDSFFENIVAGIMERLKGTEVHVVLVPSHKDIQNHVIFPSLPFRLRRRYENLHLVPNPFFLDIGGVIIGGSTADILFHLSKAERSKGTHNVPRVDRLISHLFNQKCFYPLYPPDDDIRVDHDLVERYAMIETAPDIMILPSNLKHFVKVCEDSVVINPENLSKGNGAGTFARVEVRAKGAQRPLTGRVSCQIYVV
ncbi:DNA polymerase alpha subunit B [Tribolium madens]|uniref:DNA polymerase alpha subunit B n=1 Tax=Tribolium madens TaxID=41895 RepID=UPI001CF75EE9|nr:DNA polymerase alpha subunit B [Tribolium madens]